MTDAAIADRLSAMRANLDELRDYAAGSRERSDAMLAAFAALSAEVNALVRDCDVIAANIDSALDDCALLASIVGDKNTTNNPSK